MAIATNAMILWNIFQIVPSCSILRRWWPVNMKWTPNPNDQSEVGTAAQRSEFLRILFSYARSQDLMVHNDSFGALADAHM